MQEDPTPGAPPWPVSVEVSVADLIAAAVLACPSVAALHGGRFGEAATYLPRRRVTGVRITPDEVIVHVVGLYPAPVTDIDTEIRAAVPPHLAGVPLAIIVEDYAVAAVADTTEAVTIPADTIPADTIPADTIPADTIPADTTPTSATSTAPAPSGPGTAAQPSAAPPPARLARVTTAALTKEIL